MPIGFDSFTIKQQHVVETVHWDELQAMVLLPASMEVAECAVCKVVLGPLFADKNHHCCFDDLEVGDVYHHYCGAHCPACRKGHEHE